MTDIAVHPLATQQAQALGTPPIETMLRDSTPFSHPRGNRRYDRFMLLVRDGVVRSVELIDTDIVRDRKRAKDQKRLLRHQAEQEGVIDLTLDEPGPTDQAVVLGPYSRY